MGNRAEGVRVTAPVVLTVAAIEGAQLARIVDDFLALLAEADPGDPAITRLTPTPYPDDDDASAEFAAATHDDLIDRRLLDARTMRAGLSAFDPESTLTADQAREPREVTIRRTDLDSWLRTLTAIRLVIATRLGITVEEPSADGEAMAVYDWLGYRLELLIEAADDVGA